MRLPCRSFCVGALSLALMATSACAHDLTVEVLGARSDKGTVDGALYTVFEVLNDPAGGCWLSIREKV